MFLTLKLNLSGPAGRLARQVDRAGQDGGVLVPFWTFFRYDIKPGGRRLRPPAPPTVKKCCRSLTVCPISD